MGTSLKLTDARFDDDKVLRSLTLPFLNGLTTEYILRESLAKSQRNLAAGANQLTEIGSPTWNSDSVSFNTSVVNTGLQMTTSTTQSENTLIAVAEKGWADGRMVYGGSWSLGGSSTGDAFNPFVTGAYAGLDRTAQITRADLTDTGFFCFIGRGIAGSTRKISAWNNGVEIQEVASNTEGAASAGVLQLGGNDGANNNGSFKVAYFAHFNRMLSDEECVAAYASLKAYFARLGTAIS